MIKQNNKTFAWMLATALDMVEESMYFCETSAHTLSVHHNKAAADIFNEALCRFREEESLLLEASAVITLPSIPPWELSYQNYEHPAPDLMEAHYLMSQSQALHLVEKLIQVHTCFYNDIKANNPIDKTLNLVQKLQAYCFSCLKNLQAHRLQCEASELKSHQSGSSEPLDLDEAVAQS